MVHGAWCMVHGAWCMVYMHAHTCSGMILARADTSSPGNSSLKSCGVCRAESGASSSYRVSSHTCHGTLGLDIASMVSSSWPREHSHLLPARCTYSIMPVRPTYYLLSSPAAARPAGSRQHAAAASGASGARRSLSMWPRCRAACGSVASPPAWVRARFASRCGTRLQPGNCRSLV